MIARIQEFFNQEQKWTSFNYLGTPIFLTPSRTKDWARILEKMRKMMGGWGSQWINPASSIILIKSVLSTLSIYQSSTLLAPTMSINLISKDIRKFLLQGGKANQKRFHLIN